MSSQRSYRRDCPACEASIGASSRFCAKCGAEVRTERITAKVTDEVPSTNIDEYAVPDPIVDAIGPDQSVYALVEDPDRPIRRMLSLPALGTIAYPIVRPIHSVLPWFADVAMRDGVIAQEGELEVGELAAFDIHGKIFVHRVIETGPDLATFQGDNNPETIDGLAWQCSHCSILTESGQMTIQAALEAGGRP